MCYVCFGLSVPSTLLWLFSPGTQASVHVLKIDPDSCADMPYLCLMCGSKTHIKPLILGELFYCKVVSGVSCQLPGRAHNIPLS